MNDLMKERKYFETQRQAAAVLGLSVDLIRDSKAMGCPAFKSGRIYREALLEWLEDRQAPRPIPAQERAVQVSIEQDNLDFAREEWAERRARLFAVDELLEMGYAAGMWDFKQYARIVEKTVELLIKLGRVLNAGIDEIGYVRNWTAIIEQEALRVNQRNKRARAQARKKGVRNE